MRKTSIDLRVNWGDTDKAGIVYYPNFFKWFDIAGHQFFRECGLAPAYLEKEYNIIVPLLDAQCTFKKPLLYDDVITIHTAVEEVNNKTIKLNHEIVRGDTKVAQGYEIRGWVKQMGETIKAVQIPEDIIATLKENKHTSYDGGRTSIHA